MSKSGGVLPKCLLGQQGDLDDRVALGRHQATGHHQQVTLERGSGLKVFVDM